MVIAARTGGPPRITDRDVERVLCSKSLPHFLRAIRILEPAVPGEAGSGGAIPFQPWPHLLDMAAACVENRLLAVLKARQIGATWLVAAYLAWLASYRPGTDGLLLSRTEVDAADFLARVKRILEMLPPHLNVPVVGPPSSLSIRLTNGSKLVAMASTEDAGRGHAYSIVVQDEADYHPYLDQNFAAVKPTIDAGGQLIMLSTVNKRAMDTLFKAIIRGAPDNGWTKRFYGWSVRPGRGGSWYANTRASVPAASGMTPELYMEQEYPGSETESLAASRALAAFDPDALATLAGYCEEPAAITNGGLIMVWRKPVVGEKYVAFGDVAWGQKGAYSCVGIADKKELVQVAEIYGRPSLDELALEMVKLCRVYNDAYLGVEANGEGMAVVNKLLDLGYGHRMYHRGDDWRENPKKRGWWTDEFTRNKMLSELTEGIKNLGIRPKCIKAIDEMSSFIRDEKHRLGPVQGRYADHVMMWGGLIQMRTHATYGAPRREGGYAQLRRF